MESNIILLPIELLTNNILIWLNHKDIFNYAMCCKSTNFILNDRLFWINKLCQRLPTLSNVASRDIIDSGMTCKTTFVTGINPSINLISRDIAQLFPVNDVLPYIRYKYITDYHDYILSADDILSNIYMTSYLMKKNDIPTILFILNKYSCLPFINSYVLKNCIYLCNADTIKAIVLRNGPNNYHTDAIFYRNFFDDILGDMKNRFHLDVTIIDNPNNYEIIEYLLGHVNFEEDRKLLLLTILSHFKLKKKKLRKILSLDKNYVNSLMSIIVKDTFYLSDDKSISYNSSLFQHKHVSVDFIEFILNNYNIKEDIMITLANRLSFPPQKEEYIKRLSLTEKLNSIYYKINL